MPDSLSRNDPEYKSDLIRKYRAKHINLLGFEPTFYPEDWTLEWLEDQVHAMDYYGNLTAIPDGQGLAYKELVKKSNKKRTGTKTAVTGTKLKPTKKYKAPTKRATNPFK